MQRETIESLIVISCACTILSSIDSIVFSISQGRMLRWLLDVLHDIYDNDIAGVGGSIITDKILFKESDEECQDREMKTLKP